MNKGLNIRAAGTFGENYRGHSHDIAHQMSGTEVNSLV